jgi:hypothetical protein
MYRKAVAFLLAAAPLAAAPLAAQTPLRAGQTVTGTLEAGDPSVEGVPYDAYTIRGRPGDRVLVRMRSQDFDTYLRWGRVRNGEWDEAASNDDGGEGTDSRLSVTLGADGEYELRAGAFGEATGAYELQLSEPTAPPQPGRLRVGQAVQGQLTEADYEGDNGFEDHYVLTGRADDVVTVFAQSDEFDTYLSAGTWNGGSFAETSADDDSGPGTSSQLVVEMAGGEVHVVVRSFSGESGGAYTLRVEAGAAEPVEEAEDFVGEGSAYEVGTDTLAGMEEYEDFELSGTFVGPVQAGAAVQGTLGDGEDEGEEIRVYYRDYAFRAAAGERLVIRVRSEEVDSYVGIGHGRGDEFAALAEDDDGGDGLDSLLEWEAPEAGTYTIRVTTAIPGQSGPFRLQVERAR